MVVRGRGSVKGVKGKELERREPLMRVEKRIVRGVAVRSTVAGWGLANTGDHSTEIYDLSIHL
jgi:hypothetical protein